MADTTMEPSAGPSTATVPTTVHQLPINLFTRNPSHSIPQSTYFIPSDWRRYQLSELINKVLGNAADGRQNVPFDFVVEGELLRGSLGNWVKSNRGGDEESTLNIEYIQSVLPPQHLASFPQDDWISSVSLRKPGYILFSSYLSHLQILPYSAASPSSGDSRFTLSLPSTLGATCGAWLQPKSTSTKDVLVAAGGVDRMTHVFNIPDLEDASAGAPTEVLTLHLHTAPVSSVTPSHDGSQLLTSSWDGLMGVFQIPMAIHDIVEEHQVAAEPQSYLPGQNRLKKRKLIEKEKDVGGWRRAPEMTLRGHTGRIGGTVWDRDDANKAWSAGWDGSVRGWDMNTGYNSVIRQGPAEKGLLCIDQFASSSILATGAMDRSISIWDTRESSSSVISLSLPTTSPVPSVSCHPTSPFTLASATYSGLLQIWDVRSPKTSLFSVEKRSGFTGEKAVKEDDLVGGKGKKGRRVVQGERILGLDWDGEVLCAGGEDGEVGVWRARGE